MRAWPDHAMTTETSESTELLQPPTGVGKAVREYKRCLGLVLYLHNVRLSVVTHLTFIRVRFLDKARGGRAEARSPLSFIGVEREERQRELRGAC